MKNGLIFSIILFCFHNAMAAHTFHVFCELDLPTDVQEVECPKYIQTVLGKMGCDAKVSNIYKTSPGTPDSGYLCEVISSQCQEPKITEANFYEPACKTSEAVRYFRDYDDRETYNSPLYLEQIYGMGVNTKFICH